MNIYQIGKYFMRNNISSKTDKISSKKQVNDSDHFLVQIFVQNVQDGFDKADFEIKNLIECIDKIILSQNMRINNSIKQLKQFKNGSFCQQKPNGPITKSQFEDLANFQMIKKLNLGGLSEKKQGPINQLREAESQLFQHNFSKGEKNNKETKERKTSKQQKQNFKPLQQQGNLQKIKSQKFQLINQNCTHTLQLIDQLNRQKIKRHEEMIQRMQQRQQQELNKIRELQERRIKIQLKKKNCNTSSLYSKSVFNRGEKSSLPILNRKVN